jgi:hypothetical protein
VRRLGAIGVCAFGALGLACGNTSNATGGAGGTASTASSSTTSSATTGGGTRGIDTTVAPFTKTALYFAGNDNKREVDAPAEFPATGAYQKITLHLTLSCPSGGCDAWDRFGTLGVVTAKGATPEMDQVYDGGAHTEPNYQVSALLIAYQ